MPGPMIACERSTGATGERSSPAPSRHLVEGSGSNLIQLPQKRAAGNVGASVSAWRQTRMMLDASAFDI